MKVKIGESEIHGRGLFANEEIEKNETILIERPLVAMQDLQSRQESMCCGNCLGFLKRQLEKDEDRQIYHGKVMQGKEEGFVCCCGEIFCSIQCQKAEAHNRLCVGSIESEAHPLVQFKKLAVQSNEILLLVADALVNCDENALKKFVREPWDQVVAKARELRSEPPDNNLAQSLCELCQEAATLLQQAGFSNCTYDEVSRTIGLFEQNNIGISRLLEFSNEEEQQQYSHCLYGTALFALCCAANHSCDPNCSVIFIANDYAPSSPLAAFLVANRDIPKNHELTISYIDENASKGRRRLATADYGFICSCARCSSSSSSSQEANETDEDADSTNSKKASSCTNTSSDNDEDR
uniref:SET domain-containing protein n=1 Tax=Aureoumbra lagunensis TaxID=44058 RepID=A0A7S3NGY7_9STRA|mmetsp:Transcript_15519/g.23356  ORF Transcript_15519/g.23356 Transcript_15519/m.23356 type:complete len:352 (+) Transcript_15519:60-1115(+)